MTEASLHFRVGDVAAASDLIVRWHYSKRMPSNIQCCGTWHSTGGLFGDYGPAVAACIFSIPPTRWAEPVLELSRLVRREDVDIQLTALIARTCDHIRHAKLGDLLVSFADATHEHHGGIYQAASWKYDGQRSPRVDGVFLDGGFVPGRTLNSKFGTQSVKNLRSIMPHRTIAPHMDAGKHLYWRAITKQGARIASRLKLKALSYPKPHKTELEQAP